MSADAMPAEWAAPAKRRYKLLSEADVETMIGNINADVARSEQDDPPLQAQLLSKTLAELRSAIQGTDALAIWACGLLMALWDRSQSGTPNDEPAPGPEWALIPEERHVPGSERR